MINSQKQRNKFRLKRNVTLPWELLDSEAFQLLTAHQIRVLIRFYQKRTWAAIPKGRSRKKEIVFDNTGLSFTYTEAEALGIGESSFYRAIKRLVELGFIDTEHQGGGLGRDYSRYALSERWRDYGTPSFKKVMKERVLPPGVDINSRLQKIEAKQKKLSGMNTLSCQN